MKTFFYLLLALCCAACAPKKQPVSLIFDTDMAPDYDDVGAMAVLHALADSGEVDILATVSSNKQETTAPCISGGPGFPSARRKAKGSVWIPGIKG